MAYNSTLPTPKIEGALLASLKTKKIEYNITQDKSSNYASLAEAIAAVDDDEYKVKGIVLTFYTGTDWVSKRYNGEDSSGFANEGNWIDVGGAVGGTQYLDLSMFSAESGTLSEEDYQKVVKAYNDGVTVGLLNDTKFAILIFRDSSDTSITLNALESNGNDIYLSATQISIKNEDKTYTGNINNIAKFLILYRNGFGTQALTDNGEYAEFAKPTKVEDKSDPSGGQISHTVQISPNVFYKFGKSMVLTITLAPETNGIYNEYMFEFEVGAPFQLSLPETVKWYGGSAPTFDYGKTYQVSIVNNLALVASF